MKCVKCGINTECNYCYDCANMKRCGNCNHMRSTTWSTEQRQNIGKCRITNVVVKSSFDCCEKYVESII